MIYYKTNDEIELLRQSSLLVSKTHATIIPYLKEGVTGKKIDKIAEEFIRDNKAIPAFKGLRGFPATLCISPNEQVVHGIPSDEPFKNGDVLSIDCGVKMNEFFGDSAYTYAIGEITEEVRNLLEVTRQSLYDAIEFAVHGKRLGDIGYAVQNLAEKKHKYGVVRELVGHGVGRTLHEEPEVPNYGRRGTGPLLKEGLVLAIEPMVNLGVKEIVQLKDGWTIITKDKKPSAHFEHTVAVKKGKADILSSFEILEEEIKKNENLTSFFK
ncbi:MAG: type I methionyl aminopeptidase [Chitinophagaceae bacterium]|nr:MAG: type I methionyl aminopeptidase [Chitinophagaceae bacterium]